MIWIKENGDLILLHPHQVASIEITMLKVSFSIVRMRPSHNICMREVRSGIKLPALRTETDPVSKVAREHIFAAGGRSLWTLET